MGSVLFISVGLVKVKVSMRISKVVSILVLVLSCGEAQKTDEDEPTTMTLDEVMVETIVRGCVENTEGQPLARIRVLCCSDEICRSEQTGEDGCYRVDELGAKTRFKMELSDPEENLMTVLYFQAGEQGEETSLNEPIVLPQRNNEMQAWPSDAGGTVDLLDGGLQLSAGPESLVYPIGVDERLLVQELSADVRPPYASQPWVKSDGTVSDVITLAFMPIEVHAEREYCRDGLCRKPCNGRGECRGSAICNEGGCIADEDSLQCETDRECAEPVEFRFQDTRLGEPGDVWTVHTMDPLNAEWIDAGRAVVDDTGALVSGLDTTLYHLSTVLFVRSP